MLNSSVQKLQSCDPIASPNQGTRRIVHVILYYHDHVTIISPVQCGGRTKTTQITTDSEIVHR